ncbi:hypothetical protein ACFPRL_06385 [Pseudoclavibacter helvolus]
MASSSFSASSRPVLPTMRSARASRLRRLNFTVPLSQVKPTSFRTQQRSCAHSCTGHFGCAARGDVRASLSCASRRSSDVRRTADRSRPRSRRSRVQFE